MEHVRVKICGLTMPEQARAIIEMGADAIGLIFAESKRQVTADQAAAITDELPPGAAVGVFVDSSAEQINAIAGKTRLACAQLHGNEPPEIVAKLTLPCVKAFRVRNGSWLEEVHNWLASVPEPAREKVMGIMLDTFSPAAAGGTGEAFNWDLVSDARAAGGVNGLPPLILAGGLDATNVVGAIATVQPWGVDASSGVETEPGVKDMEKVAAFLTAAAACKSCK
ncbi:MAG: phosphoribosylanthranilate isomerase [Phycisphaerae bacterium]|nr:phosphoribosylanthranilate isomerase [Phycisphaerae bacterium]